MTDKIRDSIICWIESDGDGVRVGDLLPISEAPAVVRRAAFAAQSAGKHNGAVRVGSRLWAYQC